MDIQIINPIEYPNWDDLLLTNPKTSFFHTSTWAKVLSESYNYKPRYFTIIEDDKLFALIPVMEIKSIVTGKRGVSLPFTDECRPIAQDSETFKELLKYVFEYGKGACWKHVEFRGDNDGFKQVRVYEDHYTHSLELDENAEKIFSAFKSSVKRNINKARKVPLQVALSNTWAAIRAFYHLNCMTRKRHGLPPQPLSFFKKIYNFVIATQQGFVAMAFYREKPVAGAIFFHHADSAIYKYGASDQNYLKLRPNNLVMWEAIQWYCQKGFKSFSFGRTDLENSGLRQFKRGWGTKEEKLHYYKYDMIKNCFITKRTGLKTSYDFFRYLPSWLLRLTGSILYRHVG